MTGGQDRNSKDRRVPGAANPPPGRAAGVPVAALLFDPEARPVLADLQALSLGRAFRVMDDGGVGGHARLLCDGLAFDCQGLAPATARRIDTPLQSITLPAGFAAADQALVTLSPGAELAGAARLLPVLRVLSGLVITLADLPGVRAIAWLPARMAMSPAWFAEAVGIWLNGGPFPALALTALSRSDEGFTSRGLAYFIGQEFVLTGRNGVVRDTDARGAIRLTDWLVAHGRIDSPQTVELPGFGTVYLEPAGSDAVLARTL